MENMQAQEADSDEEASIKTEYARSNERSERPMMSAKSVRDIILNVPRSFSHLSNEDGIMSFHHESDDGDVEEAATTSKPPKTAAALARYEIEVPYVPKAATNPLPPPPSSKVTAQSAGMTESGSFDSGSATLTLPQRYALSVARSPIKHLSVSFAIAALVSLIGLTLGDVQIEYIGGWFTQG